MGAADGLIGAVIGGVLTAGASGWATWYGLNRTKSEAATSREHDRALANEAREHDREAAREERLQQAIGAALPATSALIVALSGGDMVTMDRALAALAREHQVVLSRLGPEMRSARDVIDQGMLEMSYALHPTMGQAWNLVSAQVTAAAYQEALRFLADPADDIRSGGKTMVSIRAAYREP